MRLSETGLALLIRLEGCRLHPYKDVAGLWTIGTGHLVTRSELASGKLHIDGVPVRYWQARLTEAQAEALLRQDLAPVEAAVGQVAVPLTQGQYDALCSFCFNVGISAFKNSTLRKKLEAGDYGAAKGQLLRWIFAGGDYIQGLRNRRDQEIAMWDS